jgi:Carboxypeptidase regulatory-like domain
MNQPLFARSLAVTLFVIFAASPAGVACRHAVIVADTGPKPPTADGTISGQLQTPGNGAPVVGRTVTAINNADGRRHQVTTNNTGGFTLKVPPGRYRIEVERQSGEVVSGAPTDQQVGQSDVDSQLVITVGPA